MEIYALDHVQLAMPEGGEENARAFYRDVLGLAEQPKPPVLARRGGAWFSNGSVQIHLGIEKQFQPAKKAHPAFLVRDLRGIARRCETAGFPATYDDLLPGYDRYYVHDPFGNRIELMEPKK